MKRAIFPLLFLLFLPLQAGAQSDILPPMPQTPATAAQPLSPPAEAPAGEILNDPICFRVRNDGDYTVFGNFMTDLYDAEDGTKARHRSNFRLEKAGAKDEKGNPSDREEFCSYGPFFAGRKLEMTLRTLIPVFSCQTRLDRGEIVIHSKPKPGGGTEISADCFP